MTETMERTSTSGEGMTWEKILVDIPQSDLMFFEFFADKLGWQIKRRQTLWDEFIANSPENETLTDDEIMEEVKAVRYAKVQNHY